MRRSPLLHPVAVLRTTIGLTQKQLGDFVNRAARTIQSIELGKLPLTEELALRIAEATGVDEAWLFAGNPHTPPIKGIILIHAGRGKGEYTKADYEYYRAYVETPIVSDPIWKPVFEDAKAKGSNEVDIPLEALTKAGVLKKQQEILDLIERDLITQLRMILAQSESTKDMRLLRWKIRRFLEDLAKEFSLEIGETGISIQSLQYAGAPPLPSEAEPAKEVDSTNQK